MAEQITDAERWKQFTAQQKIGAIGAGALTLLRPVGAALVARRIWHRQAPSWRDAFFLAGVCLTDKFDGVLARRLNVVTDWGRKTDAGVDKIANTVVEAPVAAEWGRLSLLLWAIRLGRDVGVSVARWQISDGTNGKTLAARPIGQANTALRNATTIAAVSPAAARFPGAYRMLEVLSTALTVYSGLQTVQAMHRATEASRAERSLTASRAREHAGAESQASHQP